MAKTVKVERKPFTLKKPTKRKAPTLPVIPGAKYTQESFEFLFNINEQFRADHTYWRVNPYGDIRELIVEGKIKVEYLKGTIKEIEQAVEKMEEFIGGTKK